MNVLVRNNYSQESTWRSALGNKEPLLVFALNGESLDAPENIPAGAMRSTKLGGFAALSVPRG